MTATIEIERDHKPTLLELILKRLFNITPPDVDLIEVTVEGEYIPGEPMVRYYRDGSGYPGSDPYVELEEATVDGVDFDLGELTENEIRLAEDTIMENVECDYEPPCNEDDWRDYGQYDARLMGAM